MKIVSVIGNRPQFIKFALSKNYDGNLNPYSFGQSDTRLLKLEELIS